MTQPELTAWIQKARDGDRSAQEALILEIQDRVYFHCRKMMKNESDAQDAAQDVLIAVLTGLDKLREPAAFYGWVNGITANRCRHLLSRGSRELQFAEDEDGGSVADNLEELDQAAIPEAALDDKETQRLMMALIDALPPEQRMSVLFYYYDEMSVKEIAQAMETSEGTVKSRLNYARKSIKAGVDALEKRGAKLYGAAPLPLLILLLRMEAAQGGLSAAQSAAMTSTVLSAAQAGGLGIGAAGVSGAVGAAQAKAGVALGTKIAAGVLAAAAAVGVAAGVSHLMASSDPSPEEDVPPAQIEQPAEQPAPPVPPQEEEPSPELLALLDSVVYYGDPAQCKLTVEQAAAFAAVLRQEMDSLSLLAEQSASGGSAGVRSCAALFDAGGGTPALFFGGGTQSQWVPSEGGNVNWSDVGTSGIWQYQDGQAVPYAPEGLEPGEYWGRLLVLRDGSLFIGGSIGSDGSQYDGGVYLLDGDALPAAPYTSAGYEPVDLLMDPYNTRYWVDGAEATAGEFNAWQNQWADRPILCGHVWDGGVGGTFLGMGDAATAADALTQYAGGGERSGLEAAIGSLADALNPAHYAPVYARQVRELLASGPAQCQFDLVDIDGDNMPELLASYPDPLDFFLRADLYSVTGEMELCVLAEGLTVGPRGSGMYYYPGQNVIRLDCSALEYPDLRNWSEYYRISGALALEQVEETPETSGEALPLAGTKTAEEILALLEP